MYPEIDFKLLGKRICKYRRREKLTQEALAERIGVSCQFIGNIERGISIPSVTTLYKLILALHIPADELLSPEIARWPEEHNTLRSPQQIYCNTLSDWLGEPFCDPNLPDAIVNLAELPPIGFMTFDDEFGPTN